MKHYEFVILSACGVYSSLRLNKHLHLLFVSSPNTSLIARNKKDIREKEKKMTKKSKFSFYLKIESRIQGFAEMI